jgi:hypothetical protein
MMPVPAHLRDCVRLHDPIVDETELVATVRCPCGSEEFILLFPGQTHEYGGQQIPCTAEVGGNFFFLIKAVCASCAKEHLLIDQDFHGWNGFVCHDKSQALKPRPSLVPWKCSSCGNTHHTGTVELQTQGRQDFIEEAGDEFDAERWPEGFGWFSMAIKCKGCGKETPEWVSLETM